MDPLALEARHAKSGARFGELAGRQVVLAFTSEAEEDAAARTGAAVFDASYRDLLRVTGEDRLPFLQGMLTQDVEAIAEGGAAYAALCTAKGALVADMTVVRRREDVLLDLEPGRGAKVKAALERFLVADDAEIHEARAEVAVLESWGPRATGGVPATLGSVPGTTLYVPRAELEATWNRLVLEGARPVGFERREAWRVEAGVPRFGQDMDEETIPLEANLERAISYTKGCYLGQEVIARATYRGHVHWTLARVRLGDAPLPVGTELKAGDKVVGRLTSVAHSLARGEFLGLARVRRDASSLEAGGRVLRLD